MFGSKFEMSCPLTKSQRVLRAYSDPDLHFFFRLTESTDIKKIKRRKMHDLTKIVLETLIILIKLTLTMGAQLRHNEVR